MVMPATTDCTAMRMINEAVIAEQLKVLPDALKGWENLAKDINTSVDWKGLLNWMDTQAPNDKKEILARALKHCNIDLLIKHIQTGKAEWKDVATHYKEHLEASGFSPELGMMNYYRNCPKHFGTAGRILGFWDIIDPEDSDFIMKGLMLPKQDMLQTAYVNDQLEGDFVGGLAWKYQ